MRRVCDDTCHAGVGSYPRLEPSFHDLATIGGYITGGPTLPIGGATDLLGRQTGGRLCCHGEERDYRARPHAIDRLRHDRRNAPGTDVIRRRTIRVDTTSPLLGASRRQRRQLEGERLPVG